MMTNLLVYAIQCGNLLSLESSTYTVPRVCQTNKMKKAHYVIIVKRNKKKERYVRAINRKQTADI